jgi:hypothetical protein
MPLVNLSSAGLVQARERSVVIDYSGTDPKHLMCVENGLDHNPQPSLIDAPTVCDPAGQVVGPTKESITVRLQKTTGAAGSVNNLLPYRNTTTTISWVDEGDLPAGTPTNPEFTAVVRFPPFSLSNGPSSNPQYFEIEMPVVGAVAVNTTGTPIYAGHHGIL